MNQIRITLDGVDLKIFYGEYNQNFNLLINHFPKLKIIGRDRVLTVSGNDDDLNLFNHKIREIVEYINRYNK